MISSFGPSRFTWKRWAEVIPERLIGGAATTLILLAVACTGAPPTETPVEAANDLLDRITRPGDGGAVHLVRIVQHGDSYAFDPARLAIPSGDVVRFVMAGSQPESVAFDIGQATPEAGAFIRANSLHLGVLLVEAGQAYDVTFRGAPAGSYPFHSIPHAARGMRGLVQVSE